jgi:uncharacterized membrane protein
MNKKNAIIILGILLLSFIVSLYFYPQMPLKMASHWNAKGQVDGYMSRFWGAFFMPFILVGLTLFFLIIPRIDPLKANIEKFRGYYYGFIIVFLIFMLSVHLWIILWNVGIQISPNVFLSIGIGLLFFYMGILCENSKRNWFIGIRTPWTLSSDEVWAKTHKIGGKLFKIAGILAVIGIFFRSYTVFFILIPAMLAAAYSIVYSYFEYRKETIEQ